MLIICDNQCHSHLYGAGPFKNFVLKEIRWDKGKCDKNTSEYYEIICFEF